MKKKDLQILALIVCAYIVLCLLAVLIFNLPAIGIDLSGNKSNNTATSLSGYTAPVIGLISVILIYLAYTKQTEANILLKNQNTELNNQNLVLKKQQSIDFILSLFKSIDQEMQQTYIIISETKGEEKNENIFSGFRGFLKIHYFINEAYSEGSKLKSIGETIYGRMIIGVANSMDILLKAINNSKLPQDEIDILMEKAKNYYYSKLSITFNMIVDKIDHGFMDDDDHVRPIKVLAVKFDQRLTISEYLSEYSFQ